LSFNNLTGEVPPQLSNCKKIQHFLLNNNQLAGTMPPWLGSLEELGELDFSFNNFHGNIPAELGNCSGLLKLSLHSNKLSGNIPQEIGNLTSLNVLNLQRNNLSGLIPSTIQECEKIFELRLSENFLTGSIPPELGKLTELQVILDLSENSFSGEIPSSLGNLMKLEGLNLSLNHLQGEVPFSLTKLTSLHMLNLSNNDLQGQLPSTFSGFPLSSFLGNDKLCGPPLVSCLESAGQEKRGLSNTAVVGIIVAIVFTSSLICLVMLYMIVRIWCNWRQVTISSMDAGGTEQRREEEKSEYGDKEKRRNGEYWKVNSMALVPSQDKQSPRTCIFHFKMDTEITGNTLV
jgi:hypothetical protein